MVDLTETFNFTYSETMHEIDHEEVFIIAKPICQQMDNRSKKQDAWLTNGSVGALYTYIEWFYVPMHFKTSNVCMGTLIYFIGESFADADLLNCHAVVRHSSGSHKNIKFGINCADYGNERLFSLVSYFWMGFVSYFSNTLWSLLLK